MFRKLLLTGVAVAALFPLGSVSALNPLAHASQDLTVTAYGDQWIVWYRRSLSERWHGLGPYNYYDACNVQADLQRQGFATFLKQS